MNITTRPRIEALYQYFCEFNAVNVITEFWDKNVQSDPGVVTNFIGTKIPPKVHPRILQKKCGTVEGPPNPGNWHADIAEWAAALRSVQLSNDTYRIIELGCGWGCWMTNMGVAARSVGRKVDLIGVEGNHLHLVNAEETLHLNGFDAQNFKLFHGVAAPREGYALFPSSGTEQTCFNGEAIFFPDPETLRRAHADDSVQVLDCYPLGKLSNRQNVDLLHIDIQGAEADYVEGSIEDLNSYVYRVLIGTHSRGIEGRLMEMFLAAGWLLEMERTAVTPLKDGRPETVIDGVQMWANPTLNTVA